MKLATDFKKTHFDYKGQISRIPAGAEDAQFKSFFEGFFKPVVRDFAVDKGMDSSTSDHQDIAKVANTHARAA